MVEVYQIDSAGYPIFPQTPTSALDVSGSSYVDGRLWVDGMGIDKAYEALILSFPLA